MMPFAVAEHDGVLTLTLDTPGSPVNIFNHASARQLTEILSAVTPSTTRAIVFETAKPNSFINGVGLLLAQASQTRDDVARASETPWTAYRAVREAPVPTVAVVRGNCFGCGVEFALNCDYRIAADDCETQFYMTELNDYLFIPLFGSTWNLPEAVGLADAVDLLLWGQRWDGQKACARGLVDEVAGLAELGDRTRGFLQRILQGAQPSRRRGRVSWGAAEDEVMRQARQRIAALPPQTHEVYTDALNLLEAGARQTGSYVEHQRRELACSAASALSPIGKSAYGFFYLRQMASERAAGRLRGAVTPVTLRVEAQESPDLQRLEADLRCRRLAGVSFAAADTAADLRLVPPQRREALPAASAEPQPHGAAIAVHLSLGCGDQAEERAAAEIYAPLYASGARLVELAVRPAPEPRMSAEGATRLTRTLQRFGFEVARTAPRRGFVSDRLLIAYFAPLLRFAERCGGAEAVESAMRQAGFARRPREILAALPRAELARRLAAQVAGSAAEVESLLAALARPASWRGRGDGVLMDALAVSLLEAVLGARAAGEVRDAATVDLIARELLDFPRHLCSLCAWLKRDLVARALEGDPRLPLLVSDTALAAGRAFAAGGREFYR